MNPLAARSLGAAAGLVADRLFGEPAIEPHPVAAYGTLMARVEAAMWRPTRSAGVGFTAIGLAVGAGVGMVARPGVVGTGLATYVSVAGRELGRAAGAVGDALAAGDLDRARTLLPALVGRDPSGLDQGEIARAVVESVAENTADAVVAPALWAAVAGAPGTLGYRAVNTLDAMVGHRDERYEQFGWASARADDVANLVPARATAALVAICRPGRAAAIRHTVERDAAGHPSPNAGVVEAAFAAALDLQLGGANRYGDRVEHRARLGSGRTAAAGDIGRSVALSRDVSLALAAGLALVGLAATRPSRARAQARRRS